MNKQRYLLAVTLARALIAVSPAKATDFTLTDAAIMSLDYDNRASYRTPFTTRIVSKQDVPEAGVKFTIRFASTSSQDSTFFRLADSAHGAKNFVGIDARTYTNFALKFTLVSIDGSTSGSEPLAVGAVVGPSHGYQNAYRPEVISLTGSNPASATSATFADPGTTTIVGFTVYQSPYGWSAGPHEVTFLVQPAEEAVPLEIPRTDNPFPRSP